MLCMIPNTFKEVNIVEERNEQVVEEVKKRKLKKLSHQKTVKKL